MSSKKNKKDSNQTDKDYKNLYESQKAESISKNMLYKKMETQNRILTEQLSSLKKQIQALRQSTQQQIHNLKFHISVIEQRNKQLMMSKRQIDIRYNTTKINYQSLITEHQNYKSIKEQQIQDTKNKLTQQNKELCYTLAQYQGSMENYRKLEDQNSILKKQLQISKQKIKQIIADKDCQRILTIDSLKQQMLLKANQMKSKALQIRRQQMDTTTRLTFLQNDQLIHQLEYQTINTQKILKRNTQLQKQVRQLKTKIEILNTVESQIARRNLIAKKVIQNYKQSQKLKKQDIKQQQNNHNNLKMIDELQQKINSQKIVIKQLQIKLNKQVQINKEKQIEQDEQLQTNQNKQISYIGKLLIKYYEIMKQEQCKSIQKQQKQQTITIVQKIIKQIKPFLPQKVLKCRPLMKVQKNTINYGQLKEENIHISKYISALKRIKQNKQSHSLYTKGRSLTNLTSSFQRRPLQPIQNKYRKNKLCENFNKNICKNLKKTQKKQYSNGQLSR